MVWNFLLTLLLTLYWFKACSLALQIICVNTSHFAVIYSLLLRAVVHPIIGGGGALLIYFVIIMLAPGGLLLTISGPRSVWWGLYSPDHYSHSPTTHASISSSVEGPACTNWLCGRRVAADSSVARAMQSAWRAWSRTWGRRWRCGWWARVACSRRPWRPAPRPSCRRVPRSARSWGRRANSWILRKTPWFFDYLIWNYKNNKIYIRLRKLFLWWLRY